MSSISAAKKRRANISQPTPNVGNGSYQPTAQAQAQRNMMTIPQVLKLLDSRIVKLEKNVPTVQETSSEVVDSFSEEKGKIQEVLQEYDERFQVVVDEMQQIKDMVLKLQSYTMEVNKTLLEERMEYMKGVTPETETITMKEAAVTTPEIVSTSDDDEEDDEVANTMANTLDQTQIDTNIDVNVVVDENMDLMTTDQPVENDQDDEFQVSFSTGDNKKNRKNNKRR
tara:strand:- start:1525 stop:2202 length:678 start_codon:yes stop_codon:yes gene_type:complete